MLGVAHAAWAGVAWVAVNVVVGLVEAVAADLVAGEGAGLSRVVDAVGVREIPRVVEEVHFLHTLTLSSLFGFPS